MNHTQLFDSSPGRLNPERFVVIGEGLAAGMGEFSLYREAQLFSFPALMARQMGVEFPQPLIQPPGIGDAPGFERLPVIVPSPLQTTVLDELPPKAWANLSIPGMSVAGAVHMRPCEPLVARDDSRQTTVNLILGLDAFAYGTPAQFPTQVEAAVRQRPTLLLTELGYAEAIEAAAFGDAQRLPSAEAFEADYRAILRSFSGGEITTVVLTIPDVLDTAFCSSVSAAARVLKLDPEMLQELWRIAENDLITPAGLNEFAFQIFNSTIGPPPELGVLHANTAAAISRRIEDLNQIVWTIAREHGVLVHDLCALLRRFRSAGVTVGQRNLTADYLGGIYQLNGYYPGGTGQALIANDLLELLNQEFGSRFAPVNLMSVLSADPAAAYRPAGGPNWTRQQLSAMMTNAHSEPPARGLPTQTAATGERRLPLVLPDGLEQVLPVNPDLSYFGDAIMPLNCRTPETVALGTGGNLLFGGYAMVDSHLTGNLRIRFTPPVNGRTTFQISFEGGLTGDDQVLATPRFFKMGFRNNRVDDITGTVSAGTLDLNTGEVDTSPGALNVFAQYSSTALAALVSVNPTFPLPPAKPLSFPGQYGSACARFDARPDGFLDFTFAGTTFVPLGDGVSWPLNFTGPALQFATIPANGTVLHPHLALSTRETNATVNPEKKSRASVPENTVEEFSLFAPVSSFGDVFTLEAPQLGGPGTGRSRLLGRLQVQYGPRCGDTVPVAIASTAAGGKLGPLEATPLSQLFPGRLTPGPEGFNENLRFPLRTYSLDDLAIIDDPFDIAVGLIDARTGHMVHPLLHRGFINQDLIFALIRVEPRTPQNSFLFRGPAEFRFDRNGNRTYHFYGQVHIPYPQGFLFPDPNLSTGFPVGSNSALDPYLWLWAVPHSGEPEHTAEIDGEFVSSKGERFSCHLRIPGRHDGRRPEFVYENHSQEGRFRMQSLTWISFSHSGADPESGAQPDTISMTGFGVWSKNGIERVQQVAVQVSTSTKARFIGIQISPGDVSNVNTSMPAGAFPLEAAQPGGFECCVGAPRQAQPGARASGAA